MQTCSSVRHFDTGHKVYIQPLNPTFFFCFFVFNTMVVSYLTFDREFALPRLLKYTTKYTRVTYTTSPAHRIWSLGVYMVWSFYSAWILTSTALGPEMRSEMGEATEPGG